MDVITSSLDDVMTKRLEQEMSRMQVQVPVNFAKRRALARLLTERPEGFVALLQRLLGLRFPDDIQIHPGPERIRVFGTEDHWIDGQVVVLSETQPSHSQSFIIEVLLEREQETPGRWILRVAGNQLRLRLPTSLVIVTGSRTVAEWASTPIEIGHGSPIVPLVIGPDQIPEHIDLEEAHRIPVLAVLSVVAHGCGPEAERIGRLAIEAIRTMFDRKIDDAMLCMDVITAFLDDAVMKRLRQEMQTQPISNFAKRHHDRGVQVGLDRGRLDGYSRALLTTLDVRGLPVSNEVRARIDRCLDPATLERWHRRALVIASTDALFDENFS